MIINEIGHLLVCRFDCGDQIDTIPCLNHHISTWQIGLYYICIRRNYMNFAQVQLKILSAKFIAIINESSHSSKTIENERNYLFASTKEVDVAHFQWKLIVVIRIVILFAYYTSHSLKRTSKTWIQWKIFYVITNAKSVVVQKKTTIPLSRIHDIKTSSIWDKCADLLLLLLTEATTAKSNVKWISNVILIYIHLTRVIS